MTKLSYKGDKFIMRLRRNADRKSDTNVAFSLCDEPADYGTTGGRRYGTTGAGRFWRICTEHHCFFRYIIFKPDTYILISFPVKYIQHIHNYTLISH